MSAKQLYVSIDFMHITRMFPIDNSVSYLQGSYNLKMTIEDNHNHKLSCISFNFKIIFGSLVSASWAPTFPYAL